MRQMRVARRGCKRKTSIVTRDESCAKDVQDGGRKCYANRISPVGRKY